MKTSEFLIAAKAHIEKGWTQHFLARNSEGTDVFGYEDTAVCWCAMGACTAVRGKGENPCYNYAIEYLDQAAAKYGYSGVVPFNDAEGRTKEEVLEVFSIAIKKAQQHENV